MMTDVRELLREGAASPTTEVDVAGVMRAASGRRRRRGLVAAFGVVVLAVATLGVVRAADDGGSSARVAIGPRQSTAVPDGWSRVELDSGIQYALPLGWDVFDFGTTPEAERRIAIGTARPTDSSILNACTSEVGQIPTQPGTWVSLWEYPSSSGPQIPGPGGGDTLAVIDRPADFGTTGLIGSCRYAGDTEQSDLGAAFEIEAFRDAGRVFVARVVTAYPASSEASDQPREQLQARIDVLAAQIAADPLDVDVLQGQLAALKNQLAMQSNAATPDAAAPGLLLGNQMLNSLRISSLEPTTTIPATTVPTTNVAPLATTTIPATTPPPFVPTTTDEQEITSLFVSWLRGQTDDEIRATFEDADSILDAIHEGMAQHSEANLTRYSGVVNGIRMIDADHGSVDYTLLFAGQSQFGVRTGTAVRIDGVWKVSRDTECALLALGNVRCPARTSP